MSTLVLIRHAKAEVRAADHRGDHGRELVDRGRKDATALGQWLRQRDLMPQLALVSTAARAQQTLAAALGDERVETWTTRRIYDGGVDGVAEALQGVPDEVTVLWVVGHEPVMSTLTWDLATEEGEDPDGLRAGLAAGLPTASAAVLEVPVPWSELGYQGARLAQWHTARSGH